MDLDHLAELIRLAGLAVTNDLGRGLEQVQDLALASGFAVQNACSGLPHDLPHRRHYRVEIPDARSWTWTWTSVASSVLSCYRAGWLVQLIEHSIVDRHFFGSGQPGVDDGNSGTPIVAVTFDGHAEAA